MKILEVILHTASSVQSLPTTRLLSLLLGNEAADKLAHRTLLEVFALGSPDPPVLRECETDYRAIRIIGAAKELISRALLEEMVQGDCLSSPQAVRDYLRLLLAGKEHEVFAVVLLDAQHRVLYCEEVFRGTLNQTSVYPREVVKLALRHNAAAVIFAHNHPSGAAEPSQADRWLTDQLKAALALVDVRVLDHFIVAGTQAPLSFAERGLL
jgi:DNA repair protein RadC